jgi:polyferredoxin/Flp pilus assembly protein TadD
MTLSLPVLQPGADQSGNARAAIRKSKSGPRRAAILILIHLAFIAHLAHWWTTGRTVSPVEPSESMKTLEQGLVNAGAIFFALAILSTLIFGRFFCGWGCHIVALQDLCGWIMKKCGVRPKPFRSRILIFIPLVLALYMFIWPTFKRVALAPALERIWPTIREDLRIAPFPDEGFTNALMTEGFWDTFAPIAVAIPFLLVCGFATVYFLGAKGFCTYGCPYGGLFAPADLVSVGKIVVDHDKCHQCGHCTAVCTSNVRVHEEIREFGMVVDPGCMKCMDCVSVCPNTALSFSFARPTLFKGTPRNKAPKKIYDTTIAEDVGLAAIFAIAFFSTRGAYDVIPMLMAVGIAGCAAFIAWKFRRMLRERDARFSIFQLKRLGRFTHAGRAWTTATILGAALILHTGFVNYHRWRATDLAERLGASKEQALIPPSLGGGGFDDKMKDQARKILAHDARAAGLSDGGWGIVTPVSARLRTALMRLITDDPAGAERDLKAAFGDRVASDEGTADLGRIMLLRGAVDDAMALWTRALADRPDFWSIREHWAGIMAQTGRAPEALRATESALAAIPPERFTRTAHARTRLTLARLHLATGNPAAALAELRRAAEVRPDEPTVRENLAAATLQIEGDMDSAVVHMTEAVRLTPSDLRRRFQLGQLLLQAGRIDDAIAQFQELDRRDPANDQRRQAVAQMLEQVGRPDDAARFK